MHFLQGVREPSFQGGRIGGAKGLHKMINDNRCVCNRHTIKACIKRSWKCKWTSMSRALHLTVSLLPSSSGNNVQSRLICPPFRFVSYLGQILCHIEDVFMFASHKFTSQQQKRRKEWSFCNIGPRFPQSPSKFRQSMFCAPNIWLLATSLAYARAESTKNSISRIVKSNL